jgi:predicted nucleic acid-binding protein
MIYLDTNALIKRFVIEVGSETVNDLVGNAPPVVTAKIAFAEVHAGLKRKHREGHLSGRDYALSVRQFEDDWESYIRVDLRDEILRLARDLIRQHPLRGFDAIHLASAVSVKRVLGEDLAFGAADARLLRAAKSEGLTAVNVETA